jgi:uncharacterized protein YijF (DUF1287 family)
MKLRHMILDRRVMIGGLAALTAPGCAKAASAEPMTKGQRLATAARKQIGVTTEYDPAYRRLAYPGGDVPRKTGVCADVVVRAARDAGPWAPIRNAGA